MKNITFNVTFKEKCNSLLSQTSLLEYKDYTYEVMSFNVAFLINTHHRYEIKTKRKSSLHLFTFKKSVALSTSAIYNETLALKKIKINSRNNLALKS